MPLRDHFHPPLSEQIGWESFLSNWATRLTDSLVDHLPSEFYAEEHRNAHSNLEVVVTSYGHTPAAPFTMPALFPDSFEVRVIQTTSGPTLVAAIELVSPGNKERPAERRAFAAKSASYLHRGVSLIVMDIVTSRRGNLHNEMMQLLEIEERFLLPTDSELYAVAYRPVRRNERAEIDVWTETFAVGSLLPTLPLRLTGDTFVPVDFESTYQESCRRRRII